MSGINGFRLAVACFGLLLAGAAPAQRTDAELEASIRQGIAQFDSGDLGAARSTFESVLAEKPDHVIALYELALTHVRLGEPDRALEIIDDAVARNLPVTADFYALSASVLDNLGRVDESLERFAQGTSAFPQSHNLLLNFGITQLRMRDAPAAKLSFERAVAAQPKHPSAHFFLGQIYAGEGQMLPAILALGTAISLDDQPQRALVAVGIIKTIMDRSMQLLEDGTPMVVVSPDYLVPPMTLEKLSTGGVATYFSTAYAAQRKEGGDLSYEPYATAYALLVRAFLDADIDPATHFAASHYPTFYQPMSMNSSRVDTFAHLILAPLNREVAEQWSRRNNDAVDAFRTWNRGR